MTEATADHPDLKRILDSGLPKKFILSEKTQLDINLSGKTITEILTQKTNQGLNPDTVSDVDKAFFTAVQTLAKLNALALQLSSNQLNHQADLLDDGDSGFGNIPPHPRHKQSDQ